MMDGLIRAAARIAARKAAQVADGLADAAKAELPSDVTVEKAATKDGGVVTVAGRALLERALTEVALRGLAALAKAIR